MTSLEDVTDFEYVAVGRGVRTCGHFKGRAPQTPYVSFLPRNIPSVILNDLGRHPAGCRAFHLTHTHTHTHASAGNVSHLFAVYCRGMKGAELH